MKKLTSFITVLLILIVIGSSNAFALEVPSDLPQPYKPILKQYVDAIRSGNYDSSELGTFYTQEEISANTLDHYGYGLVNVDADNIPELVIGWVQTLPEENFITGFPMCISCVYTIRDNQVYKLITRVGTDYDLYITVPMHDGIGPDFRLVAETDYTLDYNEKAVNLYHLYSNRNDLDYEIGFAETPIGYRIAYEKGQWGKNSTQNIKYPNYYEADFSYPWYDFKTYYESPYYSSGNNDSSTPLVPEPGKVTTETYKLYNPISQEHLYTTFPDEVASLVGAGWTNEGVAWNSPNSGDPVYRLYNGVEHLYTTDKVEADTLVAQHGWQMDNNSSPVFYSGGDKPIYRVYHPGIGRHHLTSDLNEYNFLSSNGWNPEGPKMMGS